MSRIDHIRLEDVMHHAILNCRGDTPLGEVAGIMTDFVAVDKASHESAEQHAEAGAELAQEASLNAQPRTRSQMSTPSPNVADSRVRGRHHRQST